MNSEIDIHNGQNLPAVNADSLPAANQHPVFESEGLATLSVWAREADLAYQMAERMASTSFVSSTLRGKPVEVAAAILAGLEIGLKPMTAIKAIDIIQGTPALRAHAMRGLVQSHGHDIELVESTPDKCVMRGRRKGSDNWQEVTWTTDRADQMGLTKKGEWVKQRQTMLLNRATGEICRLIASDVLHGLPYVAEELEGYTVGELVAPRAPLSVSALTAPAAPAARKPLPTADWTREGDGPAYQVDDRKPLPVIDVESDAAEAADALWDQEPPAGSTSWPEVKQYGDPS